MKKLINIIDTSSELNIIQINMDIEDLKNELGINNADIAGFFGLTPMSYANSSAKKRYESALCEFYEYVKKGQNAPFEYRNYK